MTNVVIIEDEQPAIENLVTELESINDDYNVVAVLRSVEDSIRWFSNSENASDLIFLDIHLPDGLSFNIFRQVKINTPVVFTTAYDKYLLNSFEYNSIDYLLKPVSTDKLKHAITKLKNLKQHFALNYLQLLNNNTSDKNAVFKDRIVVRKGIEFQSMKTEDVAYFYTEHKLVFLVDKDGKKYMAHAENLTDLFTQLNKKIFYRANRKYIININFIKKYKPLDRVKLEVELSIPVSESIVISQENTSSFKAWIENL
ncbi:MAG TPA: LytTR family DNA-binding domain-containing protein [Panacibacter sp.]|nr:LytTR family DNA-binding domain-containing protein [Panacibacter sp.]HNP44910.1 LytTR family DNA-binding domain-containing protein [Panacibacter sp.]